MSIVEFRKSAGGVVVYKDEILVIRTKNIKGKTVYTFPKGKIEKDESPEITSIREVEEETGYKCRILRPLDTVEYWFMDGKTKVKKTVYWYLMEPLGKTREHDTEIDEVKFLSFDETKKILTYPSDKKLVDKTKEVL